jgi:hypothetical protein
MVTKKLDLARHATIVSASHFALTNGRTASFA